MKNIQTEIIINATKEEVWKTLMNHKDYRHWNPFIKKISGLTVPGEQLAVTIQTKEDKSMHFNPIVLVNKKNKEFRWKGKLFVTGLFDGEHYFILEEITPLKTRLIHSENFSGLLSGLLLKMIKKDTKKGFEAMNTSLKSLVESKFVEQVT